MLRQTQAELQCVGVLVMACSSSRRSHSVLLAAPWMSAAAGSNTAPATVTTGCCVTIFAGTVIVCFVNSSDIAVAVVLPANAGL